jgi:hypothetical protein
MLLLARTLKRSGSYGVISQTTPQPARPLPQPLNPPDEAVP